jgi:hypothetical protein
MLLEYLRRKLAVNQLITGSVRIEFKNRARVAGAVATRGLPNQGRSNERQQCIGTDAIARIARKGMQHRESRAIQIHSKDVSKMTRPSLSPSGSIQESSIGNESRSRTIAVWAGSRERMDDRKPRTILVDSKRSSMHLGGTTLGTCPIKSRADTQQITVRIPGKKGQLRPTAAMMAGIAGHVWSFDELFAAVLK